MLMLLMVTDIPHGKKPVIQTMSLYRIYLNGTNFGGMTLVPRFWRTVGWSEKKIKLLIYEIFQRGC